MRIRTFLSLSTLAIFATTAMSAQVLQTESSVSQLLTQMDMTGTWVGERLQFNQDRSGFITEFQYIYELVQKGNTVSGTSYIKSNGSDDFAEIRVRGIVRGDRFFFEEYEIIEQQQPVNKVWCLKTGDLQLTEAKGVSFMKGSTQSFAAGYGFPCSGGLTVLERIDDYNNNESAEEVKQDLLKQELSATSTGEQSLQAYPNPFVDKTEIRYDLAQAAEVQLTIYNLAGRMIAELADESQAAGSHSFVFANRSSTLSAGSYLVELKVDGAPQSLQLIQTGR